MSTQTLQDFASHNPATGEVIAKHRNTSAEEVDSAVARAHASSQAWQALGFSGRKKVLVAWDAVITKRNGEKTASKLVTGMVSINSVIGFAGIASVPFGGVKDSGYGRIHGPEGLHEFTYLRSVVSERFGLPVAFTTFKRTKFADKFITSVMKILH